MLDSKVTKGVSAGSLASFIIFTLQYSDVPHKNYWIAFTPFALSVLLALVSYIHAKWNVKSELHLRLENHQAYLSNALKDPLLDEVTKAQYTQDYQKTHLALNELLNGAVKSAKQVAS